MKRILAISLFFWLSWSQVDSFVLCFGRIVSQREQHADVSTLRMRAKLLVEHDTPSDRSPDKVKEEKESTATVSRRRLFVLPGLVITANTPLLVVAAAMMMTTMTTAITWCSQPASAKQSIKPDAAFTGILKAREELITAAQTYLPKRDLEGLRMYLTDNASNLKNFEANSQALLESKLLDTESKRAIGTIRTYGVGADVMIMFGSLQAELNENPPDSTQVSKYLMRTLDSLSEVISICRSNGFGGSPYGEKSNACIDSLCT